MTGDIRPGPARPRLVVSECLGFAAVRYNGRMLSSALVTALREAVEFVPICPEVGIGLGVPRDPIRIVREGAEERLVQPATGRDLTGAMREWSEALVGMIEAPDGFILKSRSPSCGIDDARRFSSETSDDPLEGRGPGLFARAVLEAFPSVPVVDEAGVADPETAHHFLTRVFTSARFRAVSATGRPADLTRFHAEHKFLLMAYDPAGMRDLGRIAAGEGTGAEDRTERYGDGLARILARPARPGTIADAIDHMRGMLAGAMTPEERTRLHAASGGEGWSDAAPILHEIGRIARREGRDYVARQWILEPYPAGLADRDAARTGREDDHE